MLLRCCLFTCCLAESCGVLGGGLYATCSGTVVPAVGNLFSPLLLMISIRCLLYFWLPLDCSVAAAAVDQHVLQVAI